MYVILPLSGILGCSYPQGGQFQMCMKLLLREEERGALVVYTHFQSQCLSAKMRDPSIMLNKTFLWYFYISLENA